MHFTTSQIEFYRINGYITGPRVLSDEQIDRLRGPSYPELPAPMN
jgi:hypothetical protein